MVIKSWDDKLVVTDNVLTNLPISKLSSIPTAVGMAPTDLFLISKLCDPSNMTDTGYMSYNTTLGGLSSFIYDAFDMLGVNDSINTLSIDMDRLLPYYGLLQEISASSTTAIIDADVTPGGKYNPFIVSAIYSAKGQLLSSLSGYRLGDAIERIFGWKKFPQISATNGYFDNLNGGTINPLNLNVTNANIDNLTVGG